MSETKTVEIAVKPTYRVEIGPGLLGRCGTRLAQTLGACRAAVITDTTVAPLYLETVTESLYRAGLEPCSFVFPTGERSKNLHTLSDLLEFLASRHLTRSDCVVALGGGVTGDMAGFAAGVYLRGIQYAQIPTTLLAAVDSSVGGKTAVDLEAGKNLAGVFHQPSAVLCDTDCLATLTPEIFADGAAEAIKTGVLAGDTLFSRFEAGPPETDELPELIARCVAFKGEVVAEDEFDTGLRRTLNLGHTAGHAIEKCSGYTLSHGHAVAAGMALMARAAEKLGWSAGGTAARIAACLHANHLPTGTEYSAKALAQAALSDKKRTGGTVTVVVPEAVGACTLRTLPVEELAMVFSAGLEE